MESEDGSRSGRVSIRLRRSTGRELQRGKSSSGGSDWESRGWFRWWRRTACSKSAMGWLKIARSVLEAFRDRRGSAVGHYFDLLPFASWDKPLLHGLVFHAALRIPPGMSLLPTISVGCANHRLAGEWRSHDIGRRVCWWQTVRRPLTLSREQPSLDGTRYPDRRPIRWKLSRAVLSGIYDMSPGVDIAVVAASSPCPAPRTSLCTSKER